MRSIDNLSWRLALAPGVATLLVVALIYAAVAWPLSRDLNQLAELRLRHDSAVVAQRIELAMGRRIIEMRQLARGLAQLPSGDLGAMRAELAWLKAQAPAFVWIGVTTAEGQVIAATEDWLLGRSLQGRPVFENGRKAVWFGEFHPAKLLEPFLAGSFKSRVWVADIGVPVRQGEVPQGRPAVLVAHLDIDWLTDIGDAVLGDERRRQLGLDWWVVQTDGQRISHFKESSEPLRVTSTESRGFEAVEAQGERPALLLGFQDLRPGVEGGPRWRVVVTQETSVAMAPLHRLYAVLGGLALASLLLGVGMAWWASRRLTQPYVALIDAAQRRFQAEGEGAAPEQFLRRLGEELDAAQPQQDGRAGALLHRLARNAQQMERVLDHMPMGVLLCDGEQRVIYANATFADLCERPAASLRGQLALDLMLAPDDPQRQVLLGDQRPMAARFDLLTASGGRRPVAWQRVTLFGREHQPDSLLMLVQDLSGEVNERRRADALQRRFALLVNSARSDGFVMLDAEGRVFDWSHGAELLSGWNVEAVRGRPMRSLFAQPDAADALIAATQRDGQALLAHRLRRADGSEFFADGRCYTMNDGEGGLALIFSDATQTQEAATRLQESEARLAAVISGASDAIISTDADGRVLLFNPAAERIFRVPRAQMMGQTLERLLPVAEHARHGQRMAAFATSETTRRPMGVGKVEGRRSDGETVVLEAAISAARAGGRVVLTAVLRDVSERDRADRRMVEYQVELAELTQRLLAQEKETTQRLAQALHDELGQTLAALRLMLDAVRHRGGDEPAWLPRLDATVDLANRQVREVLTALRPPLLDEQGLQAALANELAQQEGRLGDTMPAMSLDWQADGSQRWSADVEYAAFMVAREALGNALRHARASAVVVRVEGGDHWLRLAVEDDGVGVDEVASKPGHLGMVGMRERALAIGARLEIGAGTNGGLRVQLGWREDGA